MYVKLGKNVIDVYNRFTIYYGHCEHKFKGKKHIDGDSWSVLTGVVASKAEVSVYSPELTGDICIHRIAVKGQALYHTVYPKNNIRVCILS